MPAPMMTMGREESKEGDIFAVCCWRIFVLDRQFLPFIGPFIYVSEPNKTGQGDSARIGDEFADRQR